MDEWVKEWADILATIGVFAVGLFTICIGVSVVRDWLKERKSK